MTEHTEATKIINAAYCPLPYTNSPCLKCKKYQTQCKGRKQTTPKWEQLNTQNWTYYKTTPFGDNIEICKHGIIREHKKPHKRECIYCDFLDLPNDNKILLQQCPKHIGLTWHINNICQLCSPIGDK